jgi:hypothetical protein
VKPIFKILPLLTIFFVACNRNNTTDNGGSESSEITKSEVMKDTIHFINIQSGLPLSIRYLRISINFLRTDWNVLR